MLSRKNRRINYGYLEVVIIGSSNTSTDHFKINSKMYLTIEHKKAYLKDRLYT